ncbi:MAG: GtrA family protein [Bacteroidales bacterium]|nr:GtrA family protein [Bacteroidales bacterium]
MDINREKIGEFIRFGVVGVFATLLHYGIYYALLCTPINSVVGYAIGYVASFIANFYLTSYFTFHVEPTWGRFIGMAGAHGINFVLHIVLLSFFLWLGVPEKWAPLPVYLIAVPVNFLLVRFVVKRKS